VKKVTIARVATDSRKNTGTQRQRPNRKAPTRRRRNCLQEGRQEGRLEGEKENGADCHSEEAERHARRRRQRKLTACGEGDKGGGTGEAVCVGGRGMGRRWWKRVAWKQVKEAS